MKNNQNPIEELDEKKRKKLEKLEQKKLAKEQRKLAKEQRKSEKNKLNVKERFSLSIRRKWLVNGTRTVLLMAILVLSFIALNLGISTLDLPEIDVTKSKMYTLSDDSKKAIEKLTEDVKIYVYGFEEESQLAKFLKQYNKTNEKITYEILTEETNLEKIKENDLQQGYQVLILESGDSKKVLDATSDFSTVDYTTYQTIDITEQAITNAILSFMVENKPKVYFTEGHDELSISGGQLSVLNTFLNNEAFEVATINLATSDSVPEDCDILAIMSPVSDFYDIERERVLSYISKGGKIYCSIDPMPSTVEMPNIKTILAQFGVSVQNGQIIELAQNMSLSTAPNVFKPQLSTSSSITSDIYASNGAVWLAYSARLQFESEDTLTNLKVQKQDLMTSSEESIFVTDLSTDIETAIETAQAGASTIASIMTKDVSEVEGNEEGAEAKLVITASGIYISEYIVQDLSASYPLSYLANNKDFAINCMNALADKEGLTIRKEITAQATYVPTQTETFIVLVLIFGIPVLIVFVGFIIWVYRKKRK